MIKSYYLLTKPGIVYGNLFTSFAGFFLASKGIIHAVLLIETLLGIALIIASACIVNNYTDLKIDEKMERTKKRPLVTKKISIKSAIIFAVFLGILGFGILLFFTNFLTFKLGVVAYIFYTIFYAWGKRHTIHGTLIGSVCGALPPVAGYTAISNNFDLGALLLFVILITWQMPHFYAIAIYRLKDYKTANLPVMPNKAGIFATKVQIVIYQALFMVSILLLTFFKYTGNFYLISMSILSLIWIFVSLNGFKTNDDIAWARKVFFYSLIVITVFSLIIPIDARKKPANEVNKLP